MSKIPVSDGKVKGSVKSPTGYFTKQNSRSTIRGDLRSGRSKETSFVDGVNRMRSKGAFTPSGSSTQVHT